MRKQCCCGGVVGGRVISVTHFSSKNLSFDLLCHNSTETDGSIEVCPSVRLVDRSSRFYQWAKLLKENNGNRANREKLNSRIDNEMMTTKSSSSMLMPMPMNRKKEGYCLAITSGMSKMRSR